MDDHLMVYRVLERCREWGVLLYISTIDFTKASALWSFLQFHDVEPIYVRLL